MAQTTTSYTTLGNITNCQTSTPLANDPLAPIQKMIDGSGLGGTAYQNRFTAAQQTQAARQASDARRAEVYGKVGDLIAAGKCDEAKRLAAFYGHRDIVTDTAKACP